MCLVTHADHLMLELKSRWCGVSVQQACRFFSTLSAPLAKCAVSQNSRGLGGCVACARRPRPE